MIVGNLSLGQMVAQLMEVVSGLGLTNKTVGYHKAAFDDIVAFADQVGAKMVEFHDRPIPRTPRRARGVGQRDR